jgi:uncharacterized tellurite resistance protein B-like protein
MALALVLLCREQKPTLAAPLYVAQVWSPVIDLLKKYFGADSSGATQPGAADHDIRVATCALFVEMANIDGEFAEAERNDIVRMLTGEYGLSDDDANELMRLAHKELDGSIDLWRFTNLVNQNYSKEEKIQIVELIWRLVYADGHLSEHENYLIHKMGKMLRLSHRELINAKLAVLNDKG